MFDLSETLGFSPESLTFQGNPQSWTNWMVGLSSAMLGTWNFNLLSGTMYRMAACMAGHCTCGMFNSTSLEAKGEKPKVINRHWEPLKNFWRVWGLYWISKYVNMWKEVCGLLNIKPNENRTGSKLKHQGGFYFWEWWHPKINAIPFYCSY